MLMTQRRCLFILIDKATYDGQTDAMVSHINVGWGEDISVMELAQLVVAELIWR